MYYKWLILHFYIFLYLTLTVKLKFTFTGEVLPNSRLRLLPLNVIRLIIILSLLSAKVLIAYGAYLSTAIFFGVL